MKMMRMVGKKGSKRFACQLCDAARREEGNDSVVERSLERLCKNDHSRESSHNLHLYPRHNQDVRRPSESSRGAEQERHRRQRRYRYRSHQEVGREEACSDSISILHSLNHLHSIESASLFSKMTMQVSFATCEELVKQAVGRNVGGVEGKVAAGSGVNAVRIAAELSKEEPNEAGESAATTNAKAAKSDSRRRTSVTITHQGQVVATIKGGTDSWDIIEAKAKEHHQGTREWVFREVTAFLDLTDKGECAGRAMVGGMSTVSHRSSNNPTDIVANEEGKAKTLFWLMGGGGTGKSVTIAVVCKRCVGRVCVRVRARGAVVGSTRDNDGN